MYTKIVAQVYDQTLRVTNIPKLASGGENEVRVEATFDGLWAGFGKTAIFYRSEKKNQVYHVVMKNDTCVIPREVMAEPGVVYFGILGASGSTVRTSEVVALTVEQGAITGLSPLEPLPDVYKQVLEAYARSEARFDNLLTAGTVDGELIDIRVGHNGNTHASAGTAVREQIKDTRRDHYQTVGAYGYVSWGSPFTFTPNVSRNNDSYLRIDFVTDVGVYWKGSKTGVKFTPETTADLGGDIDITSETQATIYLAPYKHLVFNHIDGLLHTRNGANLQDGDITLIKTGYGYPVGGTLMDEYLLQTSKQHDARVTALEVKDTDFVHDDAVQTFASRLNNTGNVEKFLFFTDPHLCEGTGWENGFNAYMGQLKRYHDVAPVDFVICGGDWMGNSDTKAGACGKLGFVHAQMRKLFPRCYHVVGNHDTNYQGVDAEGGAANSGQLTNETIRNLWFQNYGKNYYTFEAANTTFFVFDTGLDWDAANQTMTLYYTEQLEWFKTEVEKVTGNIALVFHMGYVTDEKILHPLVTNVTAYASNFNSKHADAKVRFALTGHTHKDDTTTVNGIPMVVTTHLRDGGSATFDLCMANYDTGVLHLIRVGAGESRTVNI
jgi:predicted phosphodiesterase